MSEVDYVIVGAGSSGSVIAARLSENPQNRILVLEAGPWGKHPWLHIPIGYGKVFYDKRYNWKYQTEPEPNLNNRSIYWPRGKVLGGSSSINAMVYVRGDKADYEEWGKVAPGWNWNDVEPIFRRMENWLGPVKDERGQSGPLGVTDISSMAHPLCRAYLEAAKEAGIPTNDDYNAGNMEGASLFQITTRNGLRASTAQAYLKPAASRSNVSIVTNAHVTRILLDGNTAKGVEYSLNGQKIKIYARREVILCGGAINTPQLLQLSGIGPGALLKKFNIPVIKDQPHVGRNLIDHLGLEIVYGSKVPTLNQVLRPWWGKALVGLQFLLFRKGPLTMSLNQGGGFVWLGEKSAPPDLQLYFMPMSYTRAPTGTRPLMNPDPFPAYKIGFNPCKPESRGYLEIRSPDPMEAPRMHPNYLSVEKDCQLMIAGTRLIQHIASMPALAGITDKEVFPDAPMKTDDEILDFTREHSWTVFHQCGTCRMGKDAKSSVVDEKLKVHGIQNLRIADASIFPTIPSGNTNAPAIMVGEKAASIIQGEN
jgi:choline dehydrogenase